MENLKNNKMIAEFEGYKINYGFKKTGVWMLEQHISEEKLAYHNSWDWLMPVVEKIESFTDEQNHCKYNVLIEQSFVEIIENHTSHIIVEVDKDTKLEAIYIAVVEFIKWYNGKQ